MKKFLLLLLITLFSIPFIAQDWAPIGTTWYYSEGFSFWNEYDEDYIKFESVKDTLIYGKNCRKITKRHKVACNDRPWIEYMYSENDKVYFFDPNFNEFQMLYDFSAEQFDSWTILVKDEPQRNIDTLNIIVDSTEIININDTGLKQLHVTYQFIYDYFNEGIIDTMYCQSIIIEKIGDLSYMLNYYPAWAMVCDANFTKGLRCYDDFILGLYETSIADSCDYRHYYTDDVAEFNPELINIIIYPNPTFRHLSIKAANNRLSIENIQLFSLSGKELKIYANGLKLDLLGLPEGIYFIKVSLDNKQSTIRKIIKQ